MFLEVTKYLFQGFGVTVLLFALTLIFATPLGLILAFGGMSRFKVFSYPIKLLVWVIRGTPLMLQIIIIFYVPGLLWGVSIFDRMTAVVVAFVINYACYFSEIFRSGIQSVPQGQYEACMVLGMTKTQTFFRVILFQVIRRVLPPFGNEVITLVKDTSLARIITIEEILYIAFSRYVAKGIVWPLFYTGVYYLVFIGILTLLFNFIEKKISYYKI